LGAALAAHGYVGPAQGDFISSNADTVIGIVTAIIGVFSGFKHAATTIAVPHADPVAAQVAVNKVAQNTGTVAPPFSR
jgi:hypothetical protein